MNSNSFLIKPDLDLDNMLISWACHFNLPEPLYRHSSFMQLQTRGPSPVLTATCAVTLFRISIQLFSMLLGNQGKFHFNAFTQLHTTSKKLRIVGDAPTTSRLYLTFFLLHIFLSFNSDFVHSAPYNVALLFAKPSAIKKMCYSQNPSFTL